MTSKKGAFQSSLWRFSRTQGKTPAFAEGEVRDFLTRLTRLPTHGPPGSGAIRDLAYTFARIGAALRLKVEDYYSSGKRFLFVFREKRGKENELPVHHKLEELLTNTSKRPA